MTPSAPQGKADRNGGSRFVLALPPEPRSIAIARLFAASVARRTGCDEEQVDDIKLAVSEALTNAVKAHEAAATSEPIEVIARDEGDLLAVEVIDRGPGFDVLAEPAIEDATPPPGLYQGTLGLTVIQSLFPKVDMARNPDRGMTVRFHVEIGRA